MYHRPNNLIELVGTAFNGLALAATASIVAVFVIGVLVFVFTVILK